MEREHDSERDGEPRMFVECPMDNNKYDYQRVNQKFDKCKVHVPQAKLNAILAEAPGQIIYPTVQMCKTRLYCHCAISLEIKHVWTKALPAHEYVYIYNVPIHMYSFFMW